MADLRSTVAARMLSDSTLVSLLGTTYGGRAPILAEDSIPSDVPRPFVVVDLPTVDEGDDTKNSAGRDRMVTIRCYEDASDDTIDAIAERIRALFHRLPVSPTGETGWMASASGPTTAPTDNTLHGRSITVRVRTFA